MRVLSCMLRSAIDRRDGGAESIRNLIEGLRSLPAMEVTAISSFGNYPFHRAYAPYPWQDSRAVPLLRYFCRTVRGLAPEHDLVVLVLPNPCLGYLADIIKRLAKRPVVVNYESRWHAFNSYRFAGDNLSWRNIGRLTFFNRFTAMLCRKAADKYVVSTEFQKNELISIGYKKEQITVIPNCTDTIKYSFQNDKKEDLHGNQKIIYIGHFNHSKGVDLLIHAMPGILRCLPKAELSLISSGSGNEFIRLSNLVDQFHLTKNIKFTREIIDVPAYLSHARVLALPYRSLSKTRIIPSLILEGFSVGIPIVACDADPIRETIDDHKTGIIVPTNNSEKLAEGVIELLTNDGLCKEITRAQRGIANDRYSKREVSGKYYQQFREILYG
jgi:glycosyltransferase involved in cell wall biosynthesis